MKKIIRKIVFSGSAIYLTSLWNQGFVVKVDWAVYLKASLIIAIVYYLIVPVSKLVLLPLNLITMGLVSVVFYSLALYFLLSGFSLVQIRPWEFLGYDVSQLANIFLVAFSISTIINLMEKLL